jgi:hypothetical protein
MLYMECVRRYAFLRVCPLPLGQGLPTLAFQRGPGQPGQHGSHVWNWPGGFTVAVVWFRGVLSLLGLGAGTCHR